MKRKTDFDSIFHSRKQRMAGLTRSGGRGSFIYMQGHPHNEDDPLDVSSGMACFLFSPQQLLQNQLREEASRQTHKQIGGTTTTTTTTTVVTPVHPPPVVSSIDGAAPPVPTLQISSSESTSHISSSQSTPRMKLERKLFHERERHAPAAAAPPAPPARHHSHTDESEDEDLEKEYAAALDYEQSTAISNAVQLTASAVNAGMAAGWTMQQGLQSFNEKWNKEVRRRNSHMVALPSPPPKNDSSSESTSSAHSNRTTSAARTDQAPHNHSSIESAHSNQPTTAGPANRAGQPQTVLSPALDPAPRPHVKEQKHAAEQPPAHSNRAAPASPADRAQPPSVVVLAPVPRPPVEARNHAAEPPPAPPAAHGAQPPAHDPRSPVQAQPPPNRRRAVLPEPPRPGSQEFEERQQQLAQDMRRMGTGPTRVLPITAELAPLNVPPITGAILWASLQSALPRMFPEYPHYLQLRHEDPIVIVYRCRVYIKCPYHEKEIAKSRGALWDNRLGLWFVDPYKDLNDFIPWLDPGRRISGLLDQFRVPLTTEDGEVIPFKNEHAYIQDRMEGNVNYRRAYQQMDKDILAASEHIISNRSRRENVAQQGNAAPTEQNNQGARQQDDLLPPPPIHDEGTSLFVGETSEQHEESNDISLNQDELNSIHDCDYCHQQFPNQQQLQEHDHICPERKMPAKKKQKADQQKSKDDNQQPNKTNEEKKKTQEQQTKTKDKQPENQQKENTTKNTTEIDDDSYDENGPGEFDYDDTFLASEDDNSTWNMKRDHPRRQHKKPSTLDLYSEGESPFDDDYSNSSAEDEDDDYEHALASSDKDTPDDNDLYSSSTDNNDEPEDADNSSRDQDKQDDDSTSDSDQDEQPDNSSSSTSTSEESDNQDADADHHESSSSSRNINDRNAPSKDKQTTIDECMPFYQRK